MITLQLIRTTQLSILIVPITIYQIQSLSFYRHITPEKALEQTRICNTKIAFEGTCVILLVLVAQPSDILLKQVLISGEGKNDWTCKDNLRADIKFMFFVLMNPTISDVKKVVQTISCTWTSDTELLNTLFEVKFSEAIKNILGLTAKQITLANKIQWEKEKAIRKQDVETQDVILKLDKQLPEKIKKELKQLKNKNNQEVIRDCEAVEREKIKDPKAYPPFNPRQYYKQIKKMSRFLTQLLEKLRKSPGWLILVDIATLVSCGIAIYMLGA